MSAEQMLRTAAKVEFSETAFLTPRGGQLNASYFSPLAEVSFCGHATIASAVAHAERHGPGRLTYYTRVGSRSVSLSVPATTIKTWSSALPMVSHSIPSGCRTTLRSGQKLGLPRIRLHDLRHTHATLALRAGVHPRVVQERLGHANVGITLDTYSHVDLGMQAVAAARVAALLNENQPGAETLGYELSV
jgi:predicted PhzF superfamily epimerase YddE/YHI9